MSDEKPDWFNRLRGRHAEFVRAVEELGQAVRQAGPIDEKTVHLIQLGAATAIRSEGAVHSHARRALQCGATPQEIYHAIILVTSTVGFPNVSAALSWVSDIIEGEGDFRLVAE